MPPALLAVLEGGQERFQRATRGDRGREVGNLAVQAGELLAQRRPA
ncbi:MAG TPA: hypothetical protein VFR53_00800 [Methylomirabilota bacterium]|nr:hypothetical protein [Methylomirabilota bacterium]